MARFRERLTDFGEGLRDWWRETRWVAKATVLSACNADIDHYPEIRRGEALVDLTSHRLVPELVEATAHFKALKTQTTNGAPSELDGAIELVKASLEENKKQTEYQDDKASRLLTVTSFVSAVSAALFASFLDRYPVDQLHPLVHASQWLLIAGYATFVLFSLAALCGALVTFHATRTRFKYTADEVITDEHKRSNSMLFYKGIIGTAPGGWAKSFLKIDDKNEVVVDSSGKASLRPDLKEVYFRHYVIETYLVAAKTADKLRYLGPAQALLAWSMRLLILFVVLFALAVPLIASLKVEKPPPVIVRTPPPVFIVRAEPQVLPTPGKPPQMHAQGTHQ